MTHEQLAKKFIKNLLITTSDWYCIGPELDRSINKQVDDFFRHLKEAINKDVKVARKCHCEPDV